MSEEWKYFTNAAVAVFWTWLVLRYFNVFFTVSRWKRRMGLSLFLFFLSQAAVTCENALPEILNLALAAYAVYMVCICCFEGQDRKKLWISVFYMLLWILMEALAWYACRIFQLMEEELPFAGSVCSGLGMFAVLLLLKRLRPNYNRKENPADCAGNMILIPLGSLFVVFTLFLSSGISKSFLVRSTVSVLVVLGLNVLVLQSYVKLEHDLELKRQNTVYSRQLGLYGGYLRDKEKEIQEFYRYRHDLKQKLLCLREMLLKEDAGQALLFMNRLLEEENKIARGYSNTGNVAVDAVINSKAAEAAKLGIRIDCDLCIPTQLPFEDGDICILLGNALDNAVEAVERMTSAGGRGEVQEGKDRAASDACQAPERLIRLSLHSERGCLVFMLSNPFDGCLRLGRDGGYLSMKKHAENHGIGLESMRHVAKKYSSSLVAEADTKRIPPVFTVKVVLFPMC